MVIKILFKIKMPKDLILDKEREPCTCLFKENGVVSKEKCKFYVDSLVPNSKMKTCFLNTMINFLIHQYYKGGFIKNSDEFFNRIHTTAIKISNDFTATSNKIDSRICLVMLVMMNIRRIFKKDSYLYIDYLMAERISNKGDNLSD